MAYMPPISWFAAAAHSYTLSEDGRAVFYVEACESYQKQSYRNRCRVYSSQGAENLIVPVARGRSELPVREVKIDYSMPWHVRSKRAIVSAYKSAAYFDHYSEGIFSIMDSHLETLWELDMALIRYFNEKLGLNAEIRLTESFVQHAGGGKTPPLQNTMFSIPHVGEDLREVIHPKRDDPWANEKPYFQVFAQKHGFIPNLSIMDLLFNEGPDSLDYLLSGGVNASTA